MKLKTILLTFLLSCGSIENVGLPPRIDNRIQPKPADNKGIFYDTYLKINCMSTEGRYFIEPPKCIPGIGKVMYSSNDCTLLDSITPSLFLENNPKYATSSDIGQFYLIDPIPKLKGVGLYEIVDFQCVQVLNSRTAFDIKEIVSYQIFGDI